MYSLALPWSSKAIWTSTWSRLFWSNSISCLVFRQYAKFLISSSSFFLYLFTFFSFFFYLRGTAVSGSKQNFSKSLFAGDFLEITCFSSLFSFFTKKQKSFTFSFVNSTSLLFCATLFRYSSVFLFTALLDIFITDFLASVKNNRFFLFYCFLNVSKHLRIFLQFCCNEFTAISSLTSLFFSASWLERECWDMFGVFFLNHNNLRRILTDYGFFGFPLRKDFPITGFLESRFDEEKMVVVQEPLEITQEYRQFLYSSSWERKTNF